MVSVKSLVTAQKLIVGLCNNLYTYLQKSIRQNYLKMCFTISFYTEVTNDIPYFQILKCQDDHMQAYFFYGSLTKF